MGAKEFGEYFDRETRGKGMTHAYISVRIGEWPRGSKQALNDTSVRRLFEGGRKLTHDLVQHLIDTFGLDPAEAWSAAGLWPPDLTAADYREARHRVARRGGTVTAIRTSQTTSGQEDDSKLRNGPPTAQRGRFPARPALTRRAVRPAWLGWAA